MTKKKPENEKRKPLGVRLAPEDYEGLEDLCRHYAERAGLPDPLSQSTVVTMLIREAVQRENLKGRGKGR